MNEMIIMNNSNDNISKTILIAEDDDISFAYLEIMLSEENCKIIRAFNGLEAIKMVKSNREIDFVLMDLKMPVLNGISATYEIRKFNEDIPIIAQTAYVFESDRLEALNAGCDDYIAKPFRKHIFLKRMEKYLKNSVDACH